MRWEAETDQFVVRTSGWATMRYPESRRQDSLAGRLQRIDLILRGTSHCADNVTEKVKEKKFDAGMALLTRGL